MNLTKSRFALLPALHALLKHKNVTHAAEHLHLSQSAMSKILAQLRESFNDELLIRTGKHYGLTLRGETLLMELESLMPRAERLWQSPELDLANESRYIHLCGTDMDIDFVSDTINQIMGMAPKAGVSVTISDEQSLDALAEGSVDFVMTAFDQPREYFERALLIHSDYVVLGKHSPDIQQMDRDTYLQLSHVAFQLSGSKVSAVDRYLAQHNLSRHIVLWTPTFHHAIKTVATAATDCVLTLPRVFAQNSGFDRQLKQYPLPIDLPPIRVYLYWHRKINSDPFLNWAKGVLLRRSVNEQSG